MALSQQAAFNKVWRRFVRDGTPPGMADDRTCVYYGDDGRTRCAIGCLVSAENAKKMQHICGDNAMCGVGSDILKRVGLNPSLSTLYVALQQAHDHATLDRATRGGSGAAADQQFRKNISDNLQLVAKQFRLYVPKN